MTDETRRFQRPETVPVYAEIWNRATPPALVDPTSVKVTIIIPAGTDIVTDADMTKDTVGKYYYYFRPAVDAPLGFYRVKATVVDGAGGTAITTITPGGFILE